MHQFAASFPRRAHTPGPLAKSLILAAFASFLASSLAACSGGSGAGSSSRPIVNSTAAESAAGPQTSIRGLRFFDELETRALVAHDDALEGVLLLACGRGAATYADRVSIAKSLGLLDASFDRPAREAATIGEVSQMVARVLDPSGQSGASQERAVSDLVERGMLPPPARTVQGLTGAQLVSILGAADDEMRRSGILRLAPPSSPKEPAPGAPRRETTTPSPSASGLPSHDVEPLPRVALSDQQGPTAQATSEREAATREQVDRQIKAATLRETGGKKPVWIPGRESSPGQSQPAGSDK